MWHYISSGAIILWCWEKPSLHFHNPILWSEFIVPSYLMHQLILCAQKSKEWHSLFSNIQSGSSYIKWGWTRNIHYSSLHWLSGLPAILFCISRTIESGHSVILSSSLSRKIILKLKWAHSLYRIRVEKFENIPMFISDTMNQQV